LAADKLIAADPVYAATCAWLDAELADVVDAGHLDLPQSEEKPVERQRADERLTSSGARSLRIDK
jgi:hypothetical protein